MWQRKTFQTLRSNWVGATEGFGMQTEVSQSDRRSISNTGQLRSYAELQKQLHRDLLTQHPEWIDSDGNCPKCDGYDRRLAELISMFQSRAQNA
jgi:hypothetical protein